MPSKTTLSNLSTKLSIATGIITLVVGIWTVIAYADDALDSIAQHKEDIKTLQTVVAQGSEKIELLERTAQAAADNAKAIDGLKQQMVKQSLKQSIAVEQINLEAIKRQVRTFKSKDQSGSLEAWEHAEMLHLEDDLDNIKSKIEQLNSELNQQP